MSSHLYYDRDSPVFDDARYDALCRSVAMDIENEQLFGLGSLSDLLLHMLGDPKALRESGYQIKISQAVVGGAEAWHRATFGYCPPTPFVFEGVWNERHGLFLRGPT